MRASLRAGGGDAAASRAGGGMQCRSGRTHWRIGAGLRLRSRHPLLEVVLAASTAVPTTTVADQLGRRQVQELVEQRVLFCGVVVALGRGVFHEYGRHDAHEEVPVVLGQGVERAAEARLSSGARRGVCGRCEGGCCRGTRTCRVGRGSGCTLAPVLDIAGVVAKTVATAVRLGQSMTGEEVGWNHHAEVAGRAAHMEQEGAIVLALRRAVGDEARNGRGRRLGVRV
jgi:hypothetical protein